MYPKCTENVENYVARALVSPSTLTIKEKFDLEQNGVAVYRTPERAAKAVANHIKYWKLRKIAGCK